LYALIGSPDVPDSVIQNHGGGGGGGEEE